MELIRGIHNLQRHHYGCALTIGNFDGFHCGHQSVIAQLQSHRYGIPLIVMIFEPQPQEYFSKLAAPPRITNLRDKLKYLNSAGVDAVLCISFNKKLASLSANEFISDILIKKLGARYICVGDDFHFGASQQGNCFLLQKVGAYAGIEIISAATCTDGKRRISSTYVREVLGQDKLLEAEILMGHTYRISGRIIHGKKLGRSLGFPTANISLQGRQIPIHGVYAVEVNGLGTGPIIGVANIGTRPSLDGMRQLLEVHLLDMDNNLYGCHIEVIICTKLRKEKKFNSLNDLKRQIANDVVSTREFFSKRTRCHPFYS